MVSASQLSALFFIMESVVYIPEPCFLAMFLGSLADEFLLLPNVLTWDSPQFISVYPSVVLLHVCIFSKKT